MGESLMTDRTNRAELLAMYDALCREWQRAVELDESFLAYLLDLSLQELRERVGADVPMPKGQEFAHWSRTGRRR